MDKRLVFFRDGAALATREIYRAKRNDKTGKPEFKSLHSLDCVRYFCAQIPDPDPDWVGDTRQEEERMQEEANKCLMRSWKEADREYNRPISEIMKRRRAR